MISSEVQIEAQPLPPLEKPVRNLKPSVIPFAGRIGGNQSDVLNPDDAQNADVLRKTPDAGPILSWRQGWDMSGFLDTQLWRMALVECLGTMLIVFGTGFIAAHPATPQDAPPMVLGNAAIFGTYVFFGPLVGGITNWLYLAIFIYAFGTVSGAHLNPSITMATFFARLISVPRLVLYIGAQTLGGALAGYLLRRAYGSRDFATGGCTLDTQLVPVGDAFVMELTFSMILLFLAFGVGLDPRQMTVIGPSLAPWLVGLALGLTSFGSSFSRPGYQGASMNPARCFGAFVASEFPGYHWIHWVGPLCASMVTGIVYAIVPPWQRMEVR